MEFYSCFPIAQLNISIQNFKEHQLNECFGFCCKFDAVRITLTDNPEENLQRYLGMRHFEIIRGFHDDAKEQDFPCARCPQYIKANWAITEYVPFVNLSAYPSPCQCRCFYCENDIRNSAEDYKDNSDVRAMYENVFKTLRLAKKIGLTLPKKTRWQISPGEITIHPYKEEIMDLVRGEKTIFFTNGFIFDKDIARELHDNPLATINLSIDAGTPEAWHKVKGVNNFYHVLDNLVAYRKASNRAGQITLKYIVLPGINDSDEDFLSFVKILKSLDVQAFRFSRDNVNDEKDYGSSSCGGGIFLLPKPLKLQRDFWLFANLTDLFLKYCMLILIMKSKAYYFWQIKFFKQFNFK